LGSSSGTFILKAVPSPSNAAAAPQHRHNQISILHHLQQWGVSVAVPLPTDEQHPFVEHEETVYLLLPELPQGGRVVPEKMALANMGAAVGRLHRVLAICPVEIPSWTVDWPHSILEESILSLRVGLTGQSNISSVKRSTAGEPVWSKPLQHARNVRFRGQ